MFLTTFDDKYLRLIDGILIIRKGYAWDGASGPTWDDKTNMIGSLIHDALYQIMRESNVERKYIREYADRKLMEFCIADSKNKTLAKIRYKIWYMMVRLFGKRSSTPKQKPRGKIVEII